MANQAITLDQLKHIAKLARLNLTPDQEEKFLPQLESILESFVALSQVDTSSVSPTYQVTGLTNVLREDVIDTQRMFTQQQALSNAPKQSNGYFVTSATIKK